MPRTSAPDKELRAIEDVIQALEPLDAEARARVVGYAFSRLGLRSPSFGSGLSLASSQAPVHAQVSPTVTDIRSLKEEKQPRSAIEMAAVMAYYLSEAAPPGERKDAVNAQDLKKYFKQAGYPLPKAAHMTLVHARNAGFFDPLGEGTFRLNPVGYNLVVHGLPRGDGKPGTRSPKR